MGIGFSYRDENVLELIEVMVAQHCKCTSTNKLFTLKWLRYINFTSPKKKKGGGGRCSLLLHLKSAFSSIRAFSHHHLFIKNLLSTLG